MNSKLKKIMGICLSMVLAFSVTLPVYAEPIFDCCMENNNDEEKVDMYTQETYGYNFDTATGHLLIGKVIEKKTIESIGCVPNKNDIKYVTIRDGVTEIGEFAFQDCANLTSVTLPNSVIRVGSHAFQRCKSLSSITIGNGITSIGEGAFRECTRLKQIKNPDGIPRIEQSACAQCATLLSARISTHLKKIKV